MRMAVGTSGFAYKEWKGTFYPEDLPADGMLAFYGSRFLAGEINNTFYRMPTVKVLLQWAERVPTWIHVRAQRRRRPSPIMRGSRARASWSSTSGAPHRP